ncbi:MAG: hypothetical protein RRB22_07565 [Gammaproteobacteria bacterium]|nr:hypothetical protein [Gammaproteobacteria bacterium]
MVNFPGQQKLEAVNADKEPSFGAGAELTTPSDAPPKIDARKPSATPAVNPAEAKDLSTTPSFSAVKMLSDRYPSFVASANNERSKQESRYVLTVLILITILVLAAWAVWDPRYFHSDSDLIYNMGLTGGVLMLLTLMYALRKRLRFMGKLGDMNSWYYAHLTAGVLGPVLIIFHSSFTMKALNSSVAFIAMLCVIASGIFGRYIYTRIGYMVHERLLQIRDTEERLASTMQKFKDGGFDRIEKSLTALAVSVVNMPQSLFHMPGRFLALRARSAKCYLEGVQQISQLLKKRALQEGWDKTTYRAELAKEKRILRDYINALVQIGKFHFYERLLVGWRIFHIPLLFILFISGGVHVFSVHWY